MVKSSHFLQLRLFDLETPAACCQAQALFPMFHTLSWNAYPSELQARHATSKASPGASHNHPVTTAAPPTLPVASSPWFHLKNGSALHRYASFISQVDCTAPLRS